MKNLKLLSVLSIFVLVAGCASYEKSENPLSPSIAGPIDGVSISAPKPLEPGAGAQIPGDKQPLVLLIENSLSNGPRPLNYNFEVATDAGFTSKVFTQEGVPPGDGGRTSLRLPDALSIGRGYYWRAKAEDGANIGPYSAPVNFEVFTPLAFDKPTPLAPINNERVTTKRPEFRLTNATYVGTPIAVSYVVEIAPNSAFSNLLAAWQFDQTPVTTRFNAAADMPDDTQLFWRVRAFQGGLLGPWSDTQVFRTPVPIVVAPPAPAPGGGGGDGKGSCTGNETQPFAIVQCHRNAFTGHMNASQNVAFLQAVAADLSKKVGGGPFGLLRKTAGSSCNGFSCDIICTGNGQSQQQWDVLGDSDGAQTPAWNGPSGYPGIRIDTCSF